jgi:nitrite reductase/ring-hydroxylating ferredoxin subunit
VIVTIGVAEVPAGRPLAVRVSDTLTLVVCELDGAYHAFDEKCPHRGAALSQGAISG